MSAFGGSAHIDLTARDAQLQATLRRVRASLGNIQQRMEAASAVARNMLIATGGAIVGFLKLASDAEETNSKFDAVFKDEAGAARLWADEFAKAVGRSDTELKGFLATLQDTFVPLGFSRKQAREMSQTLTRLAVDLASFNNVAESDALASLQSALVGNHETMRKFGVIIGETTLNAALMQMGIAGGTKAATEQQKALARLSIIMAGTSDAQGDAMRTAEGFANQFRAMTSLAKKAGEELGQAFIPVASRYLTVLREALPDVTAWIQRHEEAIVTATKWGVALLGIVFIAPKVIAALGGITAALSFLIAHPVAIPIAAMTFALVGLVAELNNGKIAGIDFGIILLRLADQIGLVRTQSLAWADANDRVIATQKAISELNRAKNNAQNDRERLAIVNQLIAARERYIEALQASADAEGRGAKRENLQFDLDRNLEQVEQVKAGGVTGLERKRLSMLQSRILDLRKQLVELDKPVTLPVKNAQEDLAALRVEAEQLNRTLANTEAQGHLTRNLNQLRSGWEGVTGAVQAFMSSIQQAARQHADSVNEFMLKLELFGATVQEQQLIMIDRKRRELIEEARKLGILTKELEAEINQRFEREKAELGEQADDVEIGVKPPPDVGQVVRFEGITEMFKRIQSAAASPARWQEETAHAATRTADATEAMRDRMAQTGADKREVSETLAMIRKAEEHLRQLVGLLPNAFGFGA